MAKEVKCTIRNFHVCAIGSMNPEVHEKMKELFPEGKLLYCSIDDVFAGNNLYDTYRHQFELYNDTIILCSASDAQSSEVDAYLNRLVHAGLETKIILVLPKSIEIPKTKKHLTQWQIYPVLYADGFLAAKSEQQQLLDLVQKCQKAEVFLCIWEEFSEGLLVELSVGYLDPEGEEIQAVTQLDPEGKLRGWIIDPSISVDVGRKFAVEIMEEDPIMSEEKIHPLTKNRVEVEFRRARIIR